MPQLQFFDDTPQSSGTGLGELFGGAANRYVQNQEQQQEGDALRKIFEGYEKEGKTVEESLAELYGNQNIKNADRGNIATVLKNLDEKRISQRDDFKIAQFLAEEDLSGKSKSEILKLGNERKISRKPLMEIADKLGIAEDKAAASPEQRDLIDDIFSRLNNEDISIDEASREVLSRVENPQLRDKALVDIGQRRTDLRANNKLAKSDPEFKSNQKFIEEATKAEREAQKTIGSIKRSKNLAKSGKTSGISQQLATDFPGLSRYLKTPESVELEAEALGELKGAVQLFGGGARFTDAKLNRVIRTLANPNMSQEQQLAALDAFQNIMEAQTIAAQALRAIEDANPDKRLGQIPNLQLRVNEYMTPYLDQIDMSISELDDPGFQGDAGELLIQTVRQRRNQ